MISQCARWLGRSLARRFVFMSLALLLVVQLTSFIVIDASMRRHAHAALPEKLAMGARTTMSLVDWRARRLIEGARLLAADYGFREAVQSNDRETIASVLSNHGARIGASEVALLSTDFQLIATAEQSAGVMAPLADVKSLGIGAAETGGASEVTVVGGMPRQVVLVPLKAPRLVGWVLMYFPLSDTMVADVRKLSGTDLTIVARDRPGEKWAVVFGGLDASVAKQLTAGADLDSDTMTDVDIDGHRLGASSLAFTPTVPGPASQGAPTTELRAILSVSVDEAVRAPRDLQIALLAATLLGFVSFGVASAWTARRVTTPLQSLATAVERLGAGESATPIASLNSRDEVGELARAFEQLRGSLAAKQEQIVQSEKLASIGQLAAGVAHEINNPIGFVFSNFGTLENYLQMLFRMLAAYREEEAGLAGTPAALRLSRLREEIELDYLAEDIPALMSESKDGIKRVRKIVQDLKDFSHVDTRREWEAIDLHVGIDSTLNIVNNEIKYKADVVRDYGELPLVECLPHELNQVIMNLLVNAAHAIGPERGCITLRTGVTGSEVWIDVQDDGSGIAPADLKRIFDPFFTTKPVGKGTGLGLSLAYGIVKTHGGRIDVTSELGRGTTFRVSIPARRAAPAVAPAAIQEMVTA